MAPKIKKKRPSVREKRLGSLFLVQLQRARKLKTLPKKSKVAKPVSLFKKTNVRSKKEPRPDSSLPVPQMLEGPVAQGLQGLTTREMIKPGNELKKSVQDFFLDLRSKHTQKSYGKDLKRFIKFLHARVFQFGEEKLDRSIFIAYKPR